MAISKAEILMGRIKESELSPELCANLAVLHERINKIRSAYGKPMVVSSGYRSPAQNQAAGGAKKSNHMLCAAVDIKDDGKLKDWILKNVKLLEIVELWMEDFSATPTWLHFQIFPPKSGKRFFLP